MRFAIHREWLQKHPTPRAGDGDFHWYPAAADPALLSTIAADAAGELTVWLAPGRVVCARRFGEHAPGDGRRYTGIAATIAEAPGASAAALLAATIVPAAAPWLVPVPDADAPLTEPPACSPAAATPSLIAATWLGGSCPDAVLVPAIDTWLPDGVRARPRRVVLGAPGAPPPAAARWLARALAATGAARDRALRAWSAILAHPTPALALVDELAALDDAWTTAAALRAHLGIPLPARAISDGDADAQWALVLHAWGRGWLADHTAALARTLARRALADQLVLDDDRSDRWRRTLRLTALLPRAAADTLEREAARA